MTESIKDDAISLDRLRARLRRFLRPLVDDAEVSLSAQDLADVLTGTHVSESTLRVLARRLGLREI